LADKDPKRDFVPDTLTRRVATLGWMQAAVMSGAIDREMDDTVGYLQAGDVLVQRDTIHNWVHT
jgi:hypothetical protein